MATLKELYTTLKSLRDMNLPVDDKLLKAADNLEEKIIKEEILPALSQNIEPQLSEIQRDLVLVVQYHPGEPLSVALSRKTKISEIIDAKTLTVYISWCLKYVDFLKFNDMEMQVYNDKLKATDAYDINAIPREMTNVENS